MKQTNTQRGLVVFVGQNTKMNCLLSKEFNISSWVYKAIEKTRAITTLYSVEIGLNGDVKRFEVSDNADILSIIDTQLEDAGIYICKTLCSDEEGNRVLEEVVDVVVLGGEPGCSSSPSESVVEGAKIQMQCSVLYRGNWAPVMTWRQKGPNTTVVKDGIQTRETATNHSETASSTLTLLAMRNIHKASYTCTTYLRKYVGNLHTANTTIPDYNHTWTSPELNVKYNPRDIAISPEGYSHYVGDELTCSADANPGATYEWKDLTNGRVFKGASIRLDENMTNQKITRLLCTATNNISNSTLSVNVTVNKVLINPAMIALAVVPSSVLLVILLVVAVILYLVLTKRIASDLILRRGNRNSFTANSQEVNEVSVASSSSVNLNEIQPYGQCQHPGNENIGAPEYFKAWDDIKDTELEPVYSQVQKTSSDTEEPPIPIKKFYVGADGTEYMEMRGVSPSQVFRIGEAEANSSLSLNRRMVPLESSIQQNWPRLPIRDRSHYALVDH